MPIGIATLVIPVVTIIRLIIILTSVKALKLLRDRLYLRDLVGVL